jgi:hypothetical protein
MKKEANLTANSGELTLPCVADFEPERNTMRTLLLFCVLALTAIGAERPKAVPGFKWRAYEDLYCDIQIPKGWKELRSTAGITQVVRISPESIKQGRGIDVGFTMNTVKVKSQEQWKEAMELIGQMMSASREATPNPIQSSVKDEGGMLLMIIEGTRLISDAPHPEKTYHVRTIVRAFAEYGTVYMYSFGAPTEEWEEAWKTGKVMLNPLWFHLSK